ncbi:MAG: hypothetical protein LKK39_06605 [Oscillospiraceae bacterium]|jgi:hypothetical protein|nr:hypothetical protein [Oscillospiraceae bacterium]MCI2190701.1 hypothetical protein [Oscillospiraceae bacterium]MCI2205384.1 hypothetical protein [Oscillospiraceae bacterium]
MEPMTPDQIKKLLQKYYDIPQMIDEELATIRHCQEERGKFSLSSPILSGLPTGKGSTSDQTANAAMRDNTVYFDRQIESCQKRISRLQEQQDWCRVALGTLGLTERRILELTYLGPKDPTLRKEWDGRRPAWKQIAADMHYDEDWTRKKVYGLLKELSDLSPQEVFNWTAY